ncbi:hypothetical protein L9F63_001148, partial [Diploptera punctata]
LANSVINFPKSQTRKLRQIRGRPDHIENYNDEEFFVRFRLDLIRHRLEHKTKSVIWAICYIPTKMLECLNYVRLAFSMYNVGCIAIFHRVNCFAFV